MVLSSPFTPGSPVSSLARTTNGLGFLSLPDCEGFTQNTTAKGVSPYHLFHTGFFRHVSYSALGVFEESLFSLPEMNTAHKSIFTLEMLSFSSLFR